MLVKCQWWAMRYTWLSPCKDKETSGLDLSLFISANIRYRDNRIFFNVLFHKLPIRGNYLVEK